MPRQSTNKRPRDDHQLPPGRHGLPRSFVVHNQTERILAGVAEAVLEKGYGGMAVEDVIRHAGVSRRTFYDHFSGKEDAFLQSYDAVSEQLVQRIREAYDAHPGFVDRIRECLRAFLDFVASEPAFADMCIVQVMAAGPQAVRRRNATMHAIAQIIQAGVDEALPKRGRPPELVSETIVGGIYEVVYARVLQDRAHELPDLLPELMYSVLLPYAGRELATAELKKEQRRIKRRKR